MTSTSLLPVSASENQGASQGEYVPLLFQLNTFAINTDGILSTPTRFLMECGEWNFTPSLSTFASEMNPFDYIGIQKAKEGAVTTTVTKQHSPPTPPNSKEYIADKTNKEEVEKNTDAPPTPPQQKAKGDNTQRRPQEVNREKVSSNASLDSESSSTSGEQATGMKALTKAVEIESQQLKKQRQLQQQQELMQQPPRQTTNAKPRSQRSRPHQYSFHSYQPSKQASHPSVASTTNTTLIIKQENGQPNSKSRRQKEKSDSSGSPESGLERKRQHSEEDDDEAADRRRKFLERNRVAASKCRQKKKAWVNSLEERSEQVVEDNKRLFNMVSQLKEEAMFLKNQLLAHGDCSCNVAKQYLKQSSTFAPTIRDSGAQPSQEMLPPPPPQQKLKTSGKDYFSSVHSTPTPSLPPLRSISPA